MVEQIKAFFNTVKQGKLIDFLLSHWDFVFQNYKNLISIFTFTENEDTVDVTELKFYLHKANLHRTNPALFKRINDVAYNSDFKATWTCD